MKIALILTFTTVVFGQLCMKVTEKCGAGLICTEVHRSYGNYKACLGIVGHDCKKYDQCASSMCLNGKCTDKCDKNEDCMNISDSYCNNGHICVKRGGTGYKCENTSQCSQIRAQRTCINGVCGLAGVRPGQSCSGNNCMPGYYCDLSSKKCELVTGGCINDQDCRKSGGNDLCCNGKCREPNHANLCD